VGERPGGAGTAGSADSTAAPAPAVPPAGSPRIDPRLHSSGTSPLARTASRLDTDAAALTVILLLVMLAFSPWWLGGRIIAPLDTLHEAFAPWHGGDERLAVHNHFTSDAVTQYIVYRRIAERSFALDGRIGWSELTGGGRPEYANTMALYGDWSMQLHRFLGFWTAWHVGLMAQLLIAALGMYVLLRSQRLRPATALVGAVAFAAGTPLVFTLYHRWLLAAFCWVPWLFWSALRWRRGDARAWPLVPLFLALALLGASLQTAVFVALALAALWAGWMWEARQDARLQARLTAHVVGWGLLGAGLAAFWLVPSVLAYLDAADLHGGRSAPGYEHGPLQPLLALVFIPLQAVPTLLGSPASLDLAKLLRTDLTYVAFFGLLPTVIALRCAVWSRTPPAVRVLVLAGLLIPLTPLVGALYHRVQVLFLFGGVWAFGLYWQDAEVHSRRALRVVGRALLAVAAGWLLASLVLWLAEGRITAAVQAYVAGLADAGGGGRLGGYRDWMLGRAAQLVRELRIWHPVQLVAVAGAWLGFAALRLRARGRLPAASLVLLAAVVLELGSLAVRWHTAVDPVRYPPYPVTAELAALQQAASGGRVHIAGTHDGPAPFFPPNTLALYDIATIEQFETVDLHGMWQAAGRATDARTLGRLGVTHAVAPPGTEVQTGWRLVRSGTGFDIWANIAAVPRYLAVGAGQAPSAALDAVLDGAPDGAQHTTETGTRPPAPAVRVLAETPNRRWLVVAPGTALVRVAENWSEGWEYRSDGVEWRPAEQVPDRSMLIHTGGRQQPAIVELRYRPRRRSAGWWLSAGAAVLTLVAAVATATPRHGRMSRLPAS
jgi:hypothetical protein